MNKSRTTVILLSVVMFAALICPKSDAFTAGAGNIMGREFHPDREVRFFTFLLLLFFQDALFYKLEGAS